MKSSVATKFPGALLLFITFAAWPWAPQAQCAVLTGSIVFSATPGGQASGHGYVWDTRPEGIWLNLFIAASTTNGFVNLNGPDNSHASINILLHPGTNSFRLSPESIAPMPYSFYGVNLFLDGHILPDISAKGSVGTSVFTTNAASAPAMDGTAPPASGRLEYYNGTETVTLTECSWNTSSGPGYITLVVRPDVERLTISVSEVEVCWYSLTNVMYQMQYRSELTTNIWSSVGSPIPGTGDRLCIRQLVNAEEPKRFFSVIRLPQ